MTALSFRRRAITAVCLALPAVTLTAVRAEVAVAAPVRAQAPAGEVGQVALQTGPGMAGLLSPLSSALSQGRWLGTSALSSMASLLPAQEMIVAPQLPVRFVPGTIEKTPVTVTNTTAQTLSSTLKLSYWWAEIGSATPINGHNAAEVSLGTSLAPGASVTLDLEVRTPIQSDNGAKRLDYDLHLDLKDGAGWWSATNVNGGTTTRPSQLCGMVAGRGLMCPDRLVEDPSSNQLGLEDFLSYAGEDTGSGTAIAANLSSGNTGWSYAPIQIPSIGPSTFVRLTYNSMDVSDPGAGYGWSVQASTLTRLGSALSVPNGNATAKTMTFVDGDGTTHLYTDGVKSGALTTYRRPGGVHLDLVRDESRPVESQWVFTRPDGTRFFYSQQSGLPTSVVDSHNNTLAFVHDADGQLTEVTDARGRVTLTLGWAKKRLAWMRDISGRGVQLTYSSTGQLISIKDGGGFDSATGTFSGLAKTFSFTYTTEPVNKNSKLASITDPRGNTTTVSYFSATEQPNYLLWAKRFVDRRGHGTTFAYSDPDASDGDDVLADVTDENGATPSITTYRMDGFGRTEMIRDANVNAAGAAQAHRMTNLLWDGDHNVIKMTAPSGAVSTWDFDDATGYPLEQRDAEAVANGTPPTKMAYDQLEQTPGRPTVITSITSPPGQDAPAGRTTQFRYNESTGDLLSVIDPLGHPTTYTYNGDGTLLSETDARGTGHTTTYPVSYHPSGYPGDVTDALGNKSLFAYDDRGNVTKMTNAAGEVTTATYDAFGRVTTEVAPHEVGSTRTTTTAYDLNDNVIRVTDPTGAVTTSTYTPMDQPAADTLPANSDPATSRVATYSYDVLDRVEAMTSPAGRVTQYTYDRLGQTLRVATPFTDVDGQAKTPMTRYTYDWVGNVIKVENPNRTATADVDDYTAVLGYDRNNRQTTVTDAAGGVSTTVYDTDGTVAKTVDPTGVETTYDYDLDARLTTVTVPHDGKPRVTRYGYDEVDNQTRVTSPSGLFTETVYDKLSRPSETRSPFGPVGTRYEKPSRTFFDYDSVGRLKKQSDPTWRATAAEAPDWTSFTYHPSGDVKTSTDPWSLVTAYAYNKNGQQTLRTARATDNSDDRTMTWSYYPDGALKARTDRARRPLHTVSSDIYDSDFSAVGSYRDDGDDTLTSTPYYEDDYNRYMGGAVFSWEVDLPRAGTYELWAPCNYNSQWAEHYTVSSSSGVVVTDKVSGSEACGQDDRWRALKVTVSSARSVTVVLDGSEDSMTASWIQFVLPASNRSYTYRYDKDSVPTLTSSQVPDAPDRRWVSSPDGLGRIHQVEEFHGAETIARRKTEYRYDVAGNIYTVLADGKGTVDNKATSRFSRYAYDSRELVTKAESGSSASDPNLRTTSFTYDARGQRATITKGNGNVVTRTYFEDGRLKSTVEMNGLETVARHDLTYTLDGDRRIDHSRVANGDTGGGVLDQVATYSYTPARQLESVVKTGASSGKNESYEYDAAGNMTCQLLGTNRTVMTYQRHRLVATKANASSCSDSSNPTLTHAYDAWGRASVVKTAAGVPVKQYTYDGFDRLIEDRSFLINTATGGQAGNDVTTATVYDAFDRTTAQTTTVRSKLPKSTRFVYLGLSHSVASEEQKNSYGNWAVTKAYSYGPGGEHLSMVDTPINSTGSAQTLFYGTNPHGDVETLTTATGETKATYRYQAYGQLDEAGTTGLDKVLGDPVQDADVVNPYRFNGNRVDPATGKYDMGFRDYDPSLSRFLTRDSYNGALDDLALGLDPWTTNRYAFAGGNPVSFSELDGHRPIEENGDEVKNPEPYFPDSSSTGSSSSSSTSSGSSSSGSSSSGSSSSGSTSSSISFGGGMSGGASLALGNLLSMTCRLCSPGSGIPPSLLFRGPGAGPSSYYYRGGASGSSGLASSAVRGAISTPRGFGSTRFGATQQSRNQIFGNVARDRIASRYSGSRIERFRQTDFGGRRIDVLTPWRKAVESKVGRVSLNAFTRQQIRKDAWLLNSPRSGIDHYEWSFTRSSVTGKIGPTPALLRELRKVGIMVSYN